jgi:hypothetical protein
MDKLGFVMKVTPPLSSFVFWLSCHDELYLPTLRERVYELLSLRSPEHFYFSFAFSFASLDGG